MPRKFSSLLLLTTILLAARTVPGALGFFAAQKGAAGPQSGEKKWTTIANDENAPYDELGEEQPASRRNSSFSKILDLGLRRPVFSNILDELVLLVPFVAGYIFVKFFADIFLPHGGAGEVRIARNNHEE